MKISDKSRVRIRIHYDHSSHCSIRTTSVQARICGLFWLTIWRTKCPAHDLDECVYLRNCAQDIVDLINEPVL